MKVEIIIMFQKRSKNVQKDPKMSKKEEIGEFVRIGLKINNILDVSEKVLLSFKKNPIKVEIIIMFQKRSKNV